MKEHLLVVPTAPTAPEPGKERMSVPMSFAELRGEWMNFIGLFVPAAKVGATPAQLVHEQDRFGFRLLRYHAQRETHRGRLLIVPHIINRPYILDFRPELSVVNRFCEGGLDVFMIDWGYSGFQHPEVSFRDYSDYVRESTGRISTGKVNILGYCTGGIVALIVASLYPQQVKRLILLATPVDFSMLADPRISLARTFDLSQFARAMGGIPSEFINLFGGALFALYLPVFSTDREFLAEYMSWQYQSEIWRLMRWVLDAPAVPAQAYFEFIDSCYRQNLLVDGKFRIGSEVVALDGIKCPVLNIAARYDHLVPRKSVTALQRIYSGKDYREIIFPSSHIGLSIGRRAHQELWPQVGEWVKGGPRRHSRK